MSEPISQRASSAAAGMLRVPPHSDDAEKGVLGSMLLSPREVIGQMQGRLRGEHFYHPAHQIIFENLLELYNSQKVIDLITFTQILRDKNLLETVGGASGITSLYTFVPSAVAAEHYAKTVRDKYILRQIINDCTRLIGTAYEKQDEEIGHTLEEVQATLTELIIETERPDVFRHVREGVETAIEQLEYAYRHRGQAAITGLATGIHDFDRMTCGLQKQNLYIIGARPSQGKTALAMNIAANVAVKNKIPVGVFSMEMSFQDITNRLVCSVADVSLQRFRDGFLKEKDFQEVPKKAGAISEAPLWIDDTAALSIPNFKARARLLRTRYGVKCIILDYLQLMRSPSKRAQDARWLEITEISAGLKATAKELDIPIICCAQLNREAETRTFGKPRLADLRESGSIEQDADIVALLWRPERHIEHYKDRKQLAKLLKLKGYDDDGSHIDLWGDEVEKNEKLSTQRDRQINEYAELILAKQRNGPVGEIRLRFVGDLTKFENTTPKMWSNRAEERQHTAPHDPADPEADL